MPSFNAPMRINGTNGTLTALSLLMGNGSRIGRFGRIYSYCKAHGSQTPIQCALGGTLNPGLGYAFTGRTRMFWG